MSAAIQPMAPAGTAPAPEPTAADRVGQYVAVRDKIKEIEERHKGELAPYRQALQLLNGILLDHLNKSNVDSVASNQGTFYRSKKVSVTIADGAAFKDFVRAGQHFELVDWRASKTAVEAWAEAQGALPPGLNMSVHYEVGVRRPSNSAE